MKFWEALKEATMENKRIKFITWGNGVYLYVNKEDGYLYWNNGKICEESIDAISDNWETFDNRKEVSQFYKDMYKTINKITEDYMEYKGKEKEISVAIHYYLASLSDTFDKLNKKYKLDE